MHSCEFTRAFDSPFVSDKRYYTEFSRRGKKSSAVPRNISQRSRWNNAVTNSQSKKYWNTCERYRKWETRKFFHDVLPHRDISATVERWTKWWQERESDPPRGTCTSKLRIIDRTSAAVEFIYQSTISL